MNKENAIKEEQQVQQHPLSWTPQRASWWRGAAMIYLLDFLEDPFLDPLAFFDELFFAGLFLPLDEEGDLEDDFLLEGDLDLDLEEDPFLELEDFLLDPFLLAGDFLDEELLALEPLDLDEEDLGDLLALGEGEALGDALGLLADELFFFLEATLFFLELGLLLPLEAGDAEPEPDFFVSLKVLAWPALVSSTPVSTPLWMARAMAPFWGAVLALASMYFWIATRDAPPRTLSALIASTTCFR
jgi:hypothetical protein